MKLRNIKKHLAVVLPYGSLTIVFTCFWWKYLWFLWISWGRK